MEISYKYKDLEKNKFNYVLAKLEEIENIALKWNYKKLGLRNTWKMHAVFRES